MDEGLRIARPSGVASLTLRAVEYHPKVPSVPSAPRYWNLLCEMLGNGNHAEISLPTRRDRAADRKRDGNYDRRERRQKTGQHPQRLLARALRIADEEGAVATSLRAAVALVLRAGGTADVVDMARMTLDPLDGRSPYPAQRDWMHERLAHLRRGLDPQLVTAHGT